MSASRDVRGSAQDATSRTSANEPRLLWNQDNVKDVAESVGASKLSDEALRILSQDVEYRIGQVLIEAVRYMRRARRTTLTTSDISQAMRALDVEPMYGYLSSRPLTFGEASLGPQALFYVEDEEVDFEKLINAPLPKLPKDMTVSDHFLATDGVLTVCPENVSPAELRNLDLLPKGPGANPALPALAGQDNAPFNPSVKHVVSQELILYFEKIQACLLDDRDDVEVQRLREAALESVSSEPAIHQLVPYFDQFIANQVTHNLHDLFVLRQMMELLNALISNEYLHLSTYATSFASAVQTCMMGRRIGGNRGIDGLREQYSLREFSATLLGRLARKFSPENKVYRPKLIRSCLKEMLRPQNPPGVWFGAISGIAAVSGNADSIKIFIIQQLKDFERGMLLPLQARAQQDPISAIEFESLVGAIMKAVELSTGDDFPMLNGMNGFSNEQEESQIKAIVGDIIGERIIQLGNHKLNLAVLDSQHLRPVGDTFVRD
ncbi:TAF-domain-containing protein [Hypoxylon sp. FL0543]|nr:TAF-domain-containing protein [Hypoxylon sp. FL0543]